MKRPMNIQSTAILCSALLAAGWTGIGAAQDRSRSSRSGGGSSSSEQRRPSEGNGSADARTYADYGILTERNIFMRDRRRSRTDERTPTTQGSESPRRREESFVLRGFVIQDDARLAFIENASTNETIKAAIGDPVLQGKIVNMDLDWLEYESNGKIIRVAIGQNLTGTAGGYSGSSYTSSPASSSSSSSPPASADEAAIIERLRARRQQGR